MNLPQAEPQGTAPSLTFSTKKRKRLSGRMLITMSIALTMILFASGVFVLGKLTSTDAASTPGGQNAHITTINGLKTITQVGSTATILDTHGKQATVDPNPYKIAIAPAGIGKGLHAGDVLVSNIGNNDHGVTLVKFSKQKGPGKLFNTMNDGVLGPSALAFDKGKLLVANSTGNSILVFNSNGTLFTTIVNPLFNGPWGITAGSEAYDWNSGTVSFFTTNKFDAKILRVDVIAHPQSFPEYRVTQIGQFTKNGDVTKIDIHWLPSLTLGKRLLKDVLLAIDPANNRIAAIANSSTIHSMGQGVTVFKGNPLNMPGGMALNPLNGDLLVVNLMDNNLVELNLNIGKVVGVKQIDPAKVDNQGNGSALFGVAAVKDKQGNLRVFFTDDNTNTLDVLSAS